MKKGDKNILMTYCRNGYHYEWFNTKEDCDRFIEGNSMWTSVIDIIEIHSSKDIR